MAASAKVGDRLVVDDDRCTIRFKGTLDTLGETEFYGVEWDRSCRGRHSGQFQHKTYFKTRLGASYFLLELSPGHLMQVAF